MHIVRVQFNLWNAIDYFSIVLLFSKVKILVFYCAMSKWICSIWTYVRHSLLFFVKAIIFKCDRVLFFYLNKSSFSPFFKVFILQKYPQNTWRTKSPISFLYAIVRLRTLFKGQSSFRYVLYCIQFGKCTCKIHLPEIGTFESPVRCTHHVDLSNKSDWNGSPYFKKCRVKKVFTQSIRWGGEE